jgi:ribose transport system permease protein
VEQAQRSAPFWRTIVGALIISVVRIGMTFLGVNIFAQNIVFGAV